VLQLRASPTRTATSVRPGAGDLVPAGSGSGVTLSERLALGWAVLLPVEAAV